METHLQKLESLSQFFRNTHKNPENAQRLGFGFLDLETNSIADELLISGQVPSAPQLYLLAVKDGRVTQSTSVGSDTLTGSLQRALTYLIKNTYAVTTQDVPEGLLKLGDPYAQHKQKEQQGVQQQVQKESREQKMEQN